jgi:hypothetical protein
MVPHPRQTHGQRWGTPERLGPARRAPWPRRAEEVVADALRDEGHAAGRAGDRIDRGRRHGPIWHQHPLPGGGAPAPVCVKVGTRTERRPVGGRRGVIVVALAGPVRIHRAVARRVRAFVVGRRRRESLKKGRKGGALSADQERQSHAEDSEPTGHLVFRGGPEHCDGALHAVKRTLVASTNRSRRRFGAEENNPEISRGPSRGAPEEEYAGGGAATRRDGDRRAHPRLRADGLRRQGDGGNHGEENDERRA